MNRSVPAASRLHCWRRLAALLVACALSGAGLASGAPPEEEPEPAPLPPSPWRILQGHLPRGGPIDAPAFCIPPDLDPDQLQLAQESPKDYAWAHERAVEAVRASGGEAARPLRVLASLLGARAASNREQQAEAARSLAALLRERLTPRAEACVRLELGRLELWLRHYPEAAAQARLVDRLRPRARDPEALSEAARFVRAEALYGARRFEEAGELYRALARGRSERIMAASRLRLVDVRVDQGHLRDAWVQYDALLAHAGAFGADPSQWSVRGAEALIADGDLDAALERLERIHAGSTDKAGADHARIRIADILNARSRLTDARTILEAVREAHPDTPLGDLAEARSIMLGLDPREPDARIERLRAIARSPNTGLSIYARSGLATAYLERKRFEEALDALTRLAFQGPPAELAPDLASRIDQALRAVTAAEPSLGTCTARADLLGWRRHFLLQQAQDPEPFLRLGECYETLGFPQTAVELYRNVAKRFARTASELVAFPLARAALAAGDVPVARAAAEARVRRGTASPEWRLLLAEARIAEGLLEPALDLLRELVREGEPRKRRLHTLRLLVRVAGRLDRLVEERALIASAMEALSEDERAADPEALGEVALLSADAHRRSKREAEARRLYRLAGELLPEGPRREEAEYWMQRLGAAAPAEPEEATGEPPPSGWAQLSERERALRALRERIGIAPPAAPADEVSP